MDYSRYVTYSFDNSSAFNMYTGMEGRSYDTHWHSYGEIIVVGPGDPNIFKVNQSTYKLVPGDLVLIWPMELHGVIDANREESLFIQFSNAFMNTLFDFRRIMHFYRNLHIICVNAHPELAAKLRDITYRMKDIFFSDTADKELKCCMLLMEFMLVLDENRAELAPDIEPEERNAFTEDVMRRMIEVTDYIKHNLTAEDLSQSAMASRAGISKDYFSRLFKSVTGQNYSRWLNMIRLEKAIELLRLKDMSLTEVAMLSGFQSIPSFNRVFRSEKGMAPKEYRVLFTENRRQ